MTEVSPDLSQSYSAVELKEKGNEAVRTKNWSEAISLFTKAIQLDTTNEVFYSNRSLAHVGLKQYNHALEDAKKVVDLKPEWGRGYQRKGTALYFLEKYQEAKETFERGLSFDPENSALKSGVNFCERALRIDSIVPKGIIVPVPIIFSKDNPSDILWDVVDKLLDWYTNSGITCFWASSPASEYTHLTNEECVEFTKRVAERCRSRKLSVVTSVRPQNSIQECAEEIKKLYQCGASAVIVDLAALAQKNENDVKVIENLHTLAKLTGDIPLGIYESKLPYPRFFSTGLLKTVSGMNNVWFYIDSSASLQDTQDKLQTVVSSSSVLSPFRCYSTNGTLFLSGTDFGVHGYAGPAASFMPKIYDWLWKNSKDNNSIAKNVHAFLSIAEPTIKYLYPFNLKIFLKMHLQCEEIDAISKLPQPSFGDDFQENILRLSHLSDAAAFVTEGVSETKPKKPDSSVLL
eukprot:TRINITY_DN5676_c0_g1_i1.p1 TRINITY_DN5676_c0_g1~~TRINITY_DN5676_c0_g1_i1.p1  ORF type:complete len:461 (-),score=90.58 TRINITY_DN5676_c0_g1_i1:22-1404(-)